jgi:hypothetical protein
MNKDDEKVKLAKELAPTIEKIRKFEQINEKIIKQYETLLSTELDKSTLSLDYYFKILIQCQLLNLQMNLENMRNGYGMQLEHNLDKAVRGTQLKDEMREMMSRFGLDDDTFKKFTKGFGGNDPGT